MAADDPPAAVVYSPRYALEWPGHVFPTEKYALTFAAVQQLPGYSPSWWQQPEPITRKDLLLIHSSAYLDEIQALSHDPSLALARFEIPISPAVIEAVGFHCGGTWLAIQHALRGGRAVNLGGGFHHAFADHGEGFCFYNDIAVGLCLAAQEKLLQRAVVVDCDVHQGNGTARIFADRPPFATYSIHQEHLYPTPKQRSDRDVGLARGTDDDGYLTALEQTLPPFLEAHPADLLVYVAGADPFGQDQLADLALTIEGLARRDTLVLALATRFNLPVVAVLAGGYAADVRDVVQIHVNLCRSLLLPANLPGA